MSHEAPGGHSASRWLECALAGVLVFAVPRLLPAGEESPRRIVAEPPRLVSTVSLGPAVDAQFEPAIASNGEGYFVAWSDFFANGWDPAQTYVFGTHVGPDGAPDEARRFLLRGFDPGIATDGSRYVVAAGALCDLVGLCPSAIEVALIDEKGGLRRTVRLETAVAGNHRSVSIAWSGRVYLVTWRAGAPESADDLFLALLDSEGEILHGPTRLVEGVIDVTSVQANRAFVVIWLDREGSLWVARLADHGEIEGEAKKIARGEPPLAAAFNGTGYALTLRENGARRAHFIQENGVLLHSMDLEIAGDPAILGLTERFLFVGEDAHGTLIGRMVYRDGTSEPWGSLEIIRHPDVPVAPAIASDGSDVVLSWTSGREEAMDMQLDAIDVRATAIGLGPSWPSSPGQVVPLSATRQEPAHLACEGRSCLVFWYDVDGVRYTVEDFERSSPSTEGNLLSTTPDASEFLLDVAFNGTHYLAVWLETTAKESSVLAIRIDRQGRFADSAPFRIPLPFYDLRAASDGQDFVMFSRSLGERNRIVAVRVRASGTVVDSRPFDVLPGRPSQKAFDVTSIQTGYFLGWTEAVNPDESLVHSAFLDREGSLVGNPKRANVGPELVGEVAVGFGGGHHLIAWTVRDSPIRFERRLRVAWIDETGEPHRGRFDLTDHSAFLLGSRIIPLRSGFAVVWHRLTEVEPLQARGRFVPFQGDPGSETSLPSLIFDVSRLQDGRFVILTRLFPAGLGHVGRVAVVPYVLAGSRRRPIRRP